MIIKLIGLVTAIVLGIPVGGVYASADSPSKYLDRLTSANGSSEGMEDKTPATVSKAVMGSHGVILNTVDRNANRLEYVASESYDVVKETKDKANPGSNEAKIQDTDAGVGVNSSKRAVVNDFNDVSVQSLDWPGDGFTGSSTVTYDANGYKFPNGTTTNTVTTKYDRFKEATKYAHTDNVNDEGIQDGGYGDNKAYSQVVTIPGATELVIELTYQTESISNDWVCAYAGNGTGDAYCPAGSLTGKLSGHVKTTKRFTVTGDSVTFWFRSNYGNSDYYGYYAVVKSSDGYCETITDNYLTPIDDTGEYKLTSWNTKPDGTGENLGSGEVHVPANMTVYAQWNLNYEEWGTIGWRITDDGTLKIRPWKEDTGILGSAGNVINNAQWYPQRSKIRKIESIGNIILNPASGFLFYECDNLTDLNGIVGWDTSRVESMRGMFSGCSSLTNLSPLASWKVSNVTDMYSMFSECSNLTDLTALKGWNVSNVTNMYSMFSECSNLKNLTALASWNVSNVTNMSYMFQSCSIADLTPLASWNVSNVTNMSYMFRQCSNLADLTSLASWNVSKVTSMKSMFSGCSNLKNLTVLKGWNVSKVTDMSDMFQSCSNLTDLTALKGWDVSNVTSMNNMFYSCSNLTDLTALASWNVSKVTGMGSMFSGCSSLTSLSPLASWDVSNVTYMRFMFQWCSKLTDLAPITSWDVSNVTNMYSMFAGCSSLTSLTPISGWNVSNVTDMGYMFQNCSKLTDLTGISGWNVFKVTRMGGMFNNCSSLTSLTPISGWNVSKVTDMSSMFNNCSSLTSLTPISGWNVSKVTSMSSMFNNCSKLTDLTPLASWNVSKVTSMSSMFNNCSKLTDITGISSWNVSNVTNMSYMFQWCSSLTDLTVLKDWNMSKVTDMSNMFNGCSKIQKVGIPSIENGGQKLVARASNTSLSKYLGSRIITEDLQLGPYTWSELNTEMTTNPDTFNQGHVWVRYTPSWIVTYNTNGGVGSQAGSMIPLSESLTLPESQFLRFGYRFTGWTTQPGPVSNANPLLKVGETYRPSDAVEGSKYTLYAQWEKIGGEEDQPVTGQSGTLPGWVQVNSSNTRNDIIPNQSQSVTFTNKYDPGSTSIQFRFTKLMDGNVPDVGNSFQFELVSVSENKVIQTIVNNGASVQFDPITYDKPGEYVYYVRESPSSAQDNVNANPSIDYDDHLVEIKVTVTEADDSTSPSGKKLTATAQVTGDTTFRNDSKPASLDITKTVTGVIEGMNDNHKDREFTFKVNLLDRDNQPVTDKTYTTTSDNGGSNGDAAPSTGSITFDSKGNATVKLKDGNKLTINGIPAYYKYTITETNIPAGYDNTSLTNPNGILEANSHVTVDAVNHYTVTPANASLQAGKILLAPGGLNQSVGNGEFRFTLCQVAPPPTEPESELNTESCTGVSEASNDGNGLITFPQLMYDAPGTYQYQIREVRGDALDMTYDSTVYTVTVKVTDDGEGRLVATITYRNNTTGVESSPVSSPVWDPSDPGSMGVPVFVNRTTVANRLPVTGSRDIIIASVVLAMILSCGFMVFLNRGRREG